MNRLIAVNEERDIFSAYKETPVADLLRYHNLGKSFGHYDKATLLVAMCMDNRKKLNIPERLAFILRTGGANMKNSDFHISYAVAVGGISHMAIIGHDQCGMVNLEDRKLEYLKGMVDYGGWDHDLAEAYFESNVDHQDIGNEVDHTLYETKRLRKLFPGLNIAPLIYLVGDNKLYQIEE